MVHVALHFGERPEVAYVLPISVDGMLIVASTAMVDDKRAGREVRWSARIAFVAGVGASVAANIAAARSTPGARIVAAWPAVALLLVVEMLSRARRISALAVSAVDVDRQSGAAPLISTEAPPLRPIRHRDLDWPPTCRQRGRHRTCLGSQVHPEVDATAVGGHRRRCRGCARSVRTQVWRTSPSRSG
jgi:hypothetical protein